MNILRDYSEPACILALKNGEEKALAFFVKKYHPALTYLAFCITADGCFAEEVTSDAFIKLWERRENFNSEAALKSFLYRVVKNACFNHLKQRKRTLAKEKECIYLAESTESGKLTLLIQAETYRQVFEALKTLPENLQKVVELFYIEGKGYPEISARLNLTINNIRLQKMRGLRLLKNLISK
jgi:RNA polymerase sigma-70 factor (ECF subfamily)